MTDIVFHYTQGPTLVKILADGHLRPAIHGGFRGEPGSTAAIHHFRRHLADLRAYGVAHHELELAARRMARERAVIWCSRRSDFEPAAGAGFSSALWSGDDDDLEVAGPGRDSIRFTLPSTVAPFSYDHHKHFGGVPTDLARGFERVAARIGANPEDWFVAYDPVPVALALAIDRWARSQWVPAFDEPEAVAVVGRVRAAGGELTLDDGKLRARGCPEALGADLRQHVLGVLWVLATAARSSR